ncbi:MAG: hypothetical protein J6J66_05810 [Clostridia bacterium]|nr:hypothetical protein [Clostridia bacterium]
MFFNKTKRSVTKIMQEQVGKYGKNKIELRSSLRRLKEPTYFWAAEDGSGLKTNKLPESQTLRWEIFEGIVKKANSLGGKMYRGDSIARSGGKLGEALTEDMIDGFVPLTYEGANYGDTALSRSTYFSGILAWAGIVTIHKSTGDGSFITVNKEYRNI